MTTNEQVPYLRKNEILTTPEAQYKVIDMVGSGGTCLTYKAKLVGVNNFVPQYVALKLYNNKLVHIWQMKNERAISYLLRDNNRLVKTLGEVEVRGCPVLIQEWLNPTLFHVLDKTPRGPKSAHLIHEVTKHVGEGLKAMHALNFGHGDLELDNIMWCPERCSFVLKDFGLSFRMKDFHHRLYCEYYSAPEVLVWNNFVFKLKSWMRRYGRAQPSLRPGPPRRKARPGGEADIWAFGLIIADMVFGGNMSNYRLPNTQILLDQFLEFRLAHCARNFERTFWIDISHIIKKCLRIRPKERCTAHELVSSLWRSTSILRPDLLEQRFMPTSILMFINLTHPNYIIDRFRVHYILLWCRKVGFVESHRVYDPPNESILVKFDYTSDAEKAFAISNTLLPFENIYPAVCYFLPVLYDNNCHAVTQ